MALRVAYPCKILQISPMFSKSRCTVLVFLNQRHLSLSFCQYLPLICILRCQQRVRPISHFAPRVYAADEMNDLMWLFSLSTNFTVSRVYPTISLAQIIWRLSLLSTISSFCDCFAPDLSLRSLPFLQISTCCMATPRPAHLVDVSTVAVLYISKTRLICESLSISMIAGHAHSRYTSAIAFTRRDVYISH